MTTVGKTTFTIGTIRSCNFWHKVLGPRPHPALSRDVSLGSRSLCPQDLEILDLSNHEFRHLAVLANCIMNVVHYHLLGPIPATDRSKQVSFSTLVSIDCTPESTARGLSSVRLASASTQRSTGSNLVDDDAKVHTGLRDSIDALKSQADWELLCDMVRRLRSRFRRIHSSMLEYSRDASEDNEVHLQVRRFPVLSRLPCPSSRRCPFVFTSPLQTPNTRMSGEGGRKGFANQFAAAAVGYNCRWRRVGKLSIAGTADRVGAVGWSETRGGGEIGGGGG